MAKLRCDILMPNCELFIKAGTEVYIDLNNQIGYWSGYHFDIGENEYEIIH